MILLGNTNLEFHLLKKAVIPEPIAEKEIETPTENTTPSQYNYSYSSGFSSFFENISDEFAGLPHYTLYSRSLPEKLVIKLNVF